MSIAYTKVKSASKLVLPRGDKLSEIVKDTMRRISAVVGATLGPGGMPILIERQETGLGGMVTKDGVTVFKSLGFEDPIAHAVLETARDAAVRTVGEAGDGTTTATILAEAIVRLTDAYLGQNKTVPPQKIVRRLERVFRDVIDPLIQETAIQVNSADETDQHLLWSVAKVSANGDEQLADAVMKCFELVGDEGNVTIMEQSGPSSYQVERIEGFPVPIGYEESAAKYMSSFLNTNDGRVYVEKPRFLLHYGSIVNEQTLFPFLQKVVTDWQQNGTSPNVVVVATGFSESVLAWMGLNTANPNGLNIYPMLAPKSPVMNGELHFLEDLAAVVGAQICNPLTTPVDQMSLDVLGQVDALEMHRFRSTVFGQRDRDEVLDRVETLQAQAAAAESQLDRILLEERIGRITGGIAKLRVIGASNGELKEKRDRAEDAVMAVRGAIKHGALPGGGWMLLKIIHQLEVKGWTDPIIRDILQPALAEPVCRLFTNIGMTDDEAEVTIAKIQADLAFGKHTVYDALEGRFVDAVQDGILDSVPAVLEAIRNSISIASLLGTLGGVVVFGRDLEMERREAASTADFLRNAGMNEANERS